MPDAVAVAAVHASAMRFGGRRRIATEPMGKRVLKGQTLGFCSGQAPFVLSHGRALFEVSAPTLSPPKRWIALAWLRPVRVGNSGNLGNRATFSSQFNTLLVSHADLRFWMPGETGIPGFPGE